MDQQRVTSILLIPHSVKIIPKVMNNFPVYEKPLYDAVILPGLKGAPGNSAANQASARHAVEKYIYIDKKHSMI